MMPLMSLAMYSGSVVVDLSPRRRCRENMANYKVPRAVEIVDELPTTASGKVTKFVLRERARELQR